MVAASSGIAIIGMACRFPGAADPRAYWCNLCDGIESVTPLTDDELTAAGVPAELLRDPSYVKAASILRDIDQFDATFFEYSPAEARLMDPQQRLLLEVAWEAFEDAGYGPGGAARSAGVFMGAGGVVSSYLVDRLPFANELPGQTGSLAHISNDKDFLSTRISYKLNLTGPSITVQTACSTSLVAVHLACQAILSGECDMALAGAATVRVPQNVGYVSRKGDILSPDGHCRAFDADARGTIFGSGVGAVLLKDLGAAVADHDNIYAVIRGSAVNNDGADKVSYTASNVAGQRRAMLEAMLVADVSPDDIGYVECHGTGTIVGDPLEIDALTRAFRTRTDRKGFCAIASVKTNVGHLEQTAGLAALIKVALMLKNGKIPASLNFRKSNPKIDFSSSPFFVNTESVDWPTDRPRLAAINSLGLGGTNAFAVLEQAPPPAGPGVTVDPPVNLFILSAKTASALRTSIERYHAWLDGQSDASLPDICYTLSSGRNHFGYRFATVAGAIAPLRAALAAELQRSPAEEKVPASRQRRIAFLFSGQGSQHVGMAAELYRHQPVFRAVVDRCAALLRDRLEWPLLDVLFEQAGGADAIHETAYTQPALFAVQAALTELLRSWGIFPNAVLGHSVGEFAAAYCAGVFTLEDGISLVTERARLMQSLPRGGAMAAIFADEITVAAAINNTKNISIAAVNAPHNTVISGDREAVTAIADHFVARDIGSQRLTVSHAFHSPLMQPAMNEFRHIAATIPMRAPEITWISTTSGASFTEPPDAGHWCDHACKSVRFQQGIERLAEFGVDDFMEIGPGSTLLALGQQCLDGHHAWFTTLGNKDRSDSAEILASLGKFYSCGHEIDWKGFNTSLSRRRVSLPTYPFERRRYWLENNAGAPPQGFSSVQMSMAGQRLRSALPETQFEAVYSLARFGYLSDHRIYGRPVLPITACLTALRDAARQHFATEKVTLANLQYREALILPEAGERIVQSILSPIDDATAEFRLTSTRADAAEAWQTHVVGMARKETQDQLDSDASVVLDQVKLRCPNSISVDLYYETLRGVGLQYGSSFRAIEELWRGAGETLTRVRLPPHLPVESAQYLHPALLDACLHVYPALIEDYGNFERAPQGLRHTYLPIGIERFRCGSSGAREVWAHAVRRSVQDDPQTITIDITIYREDGNPAATLEGLSVKQLPPEVLIPNAGSERPDWLYQLQWVELPQLQEPSADRPTGEPFGWLILADHGGVAAALAHMLIDRGRICRLASVGDVIEHQSCSWTPDDLVEPFAALLAEFTERSVPLQGIVNLWPLDVPTGQMTLGEFKTSQKIVTGSALSLFRAVAEAQSFPNINPRIWLVSRNAISALPDDPPAEAAAGGLWGLGRSAALEHPRNWGGLVDLGKIENSSPSGDAAALLRELLRGEGEDQVALRAGRRFGARLVRAAASLASDIPFDTEGHYLITGGLGALGVEIARWLVTRHGIKHLLLVSRRGTHDPNSEPVRRALESLCANVTVRKADVTKEQDLRRLLGSIDKSDHPLRGVFHCAGLLDDGVIMRMDWQKFDRVAAPKVVGGWLLHELTRELSLDHFVVFSSVLSLFGSAGQANYAAANAFLDALVMRRRGEGLCALALNWGPWDESGLATLSGEKGRAIWRERGTDYISADIGQRALDRVVGSSATHAVITLTQWPIFFQQFTKVPSLYSQLQKDCGAGGSMGSLARDDVLFKDPLKGAPSAERRELLIAFVRQHAMKILGITDTIDASRPLREFGLDSLMSVTLVNRLESALGIRISTVKLIKGPSVAQVADDILADVSTGEEKAVEATTATPPTEGIGRWLVTVGPRAAPRLRLFCFPFAGGGSAVYHNWAQSLDPTIEVVAVEPPGRLGRINEKPIADIGEFVDKLVVEMRDVIDRPFAFFGHCLGGLTMYETARRLIHATTSRPNHLFVSGARPPDRMLDVGTFEEQLMHDLLNLADFRINLPPYAQPDDVFAEFIRHFNIQATEQLLGDLNLRQLMLPVIRAEFEMALNYDFVEEPPWDIPITCFVGLDDPYVSRHQALGWGRFTNSQLQIHIRQGAHFAVVDDAAFIHRVINKELRGVG
jgi:acyl transferase domain-containing protein/surfactin synthase thioesterase subunit/acyl carrier protein